MSTSIAAALAAARTRIPAAEARLLLGHVLDRSAAWLEAHRDELCAAEHLGQFGVLVERRAAGEPVAYLLGVREFYGRDFAVTPAVLIPRPETELLVETALAKVGAGKMAKCAARILDLGTGSGCIAITLALENPAAQVTAVDASAAALAVAQDNAVRLAANVTCIESDWFDSLPAGRFDLIVANPPYIAVGDPHLAEGDLRFEPTGALTDHADGLAALRRIIADAPRWLIPGGWLFFEHGYDQAAAAHELLAAAGFGAIEQHRDLAGIVRVSGARMSE
jgi:release factor glutamine methyltransferase